MPLRLRSFPVRKARQNPPQSARRSPSLRLRVTRNKRALTSKTDSAAREAHRNRTRGRNRGEYKFCIRRLGESKIEAEKRRKLTLRTKPRGC